VNVVEAIPKVMDNLVVKTTGDCYTHPVRDHYARVEHSVGRRLSCAVATSSTRMTVRRSVKCPRRWRYKNATKESSGAPFRAVECAPGKPAIRPDRGLHTSVDYFRLTSKPVKLTWVLTPSEALFFHSQASEILRPGPLRPVAVAIKDRPPRRRHDVRSRLSKRSARGRSRGAQKARSSVAALRPRTRYRPRSPPGRCG
jgi:hypothetical protein